MPLYTNEQYVVHPPTNALFINLVNIFNINTGLFEMIVGVVTSCRTQYT